MAAPFLANALLFGRVLRRAGLPVALDQQLRFIRALEWLDLAERGQLYHAARCLLVSRHEDLRLFDALFEQFWRRPGAAPARGQRAPVAPRHDPERRRPFTIATYLAEKTRLFAPEIELADRSLTWSDQEVLQHKDFSQMSAEELAAVRRLIEAKVFAISRRKTRRQLADPRGRRLDLARTLREAARTGGIALELLRQSPKVKPRPVVLLADVSGSMEKYSRLLLQFFYAVCRAERQVEVFAFGTRLTRLTPQLRLRNLDRALAAVSHEVVDWAGGTRIAESLRSFNRRFARRVLRRGAVVVIASDGWERGDAAALAREMRHLQHRCHRLIWLNPLLGEPGYAPRARGMAAALPFIDDFLPIHDLQSLDQLAEHLRSLPPRRSARRSSNPSLATWRAQPMEAST